MPGTPMATPYFSSFTATIASQYVVFRDARREARINTDYTE
jgi:hypothetical protein